MYVARCELSQEFVYIILQLKNLYVMKEKYIIFTYNLVIPCASDSCILISYNQGRVLFLIR